MSHDPKLKEAMAEIKAVCRKYDIACYTALISKSHAEFGLVVDPTWSAMYWESEGMLRFRSKAAELGAAEAERKTALTCHIVYQLRDLCAQGFKFSDEMAKLIETQIKVEHTSFAGFEPHREQ